MWKWEILLLESGDGIWKDRRPRGRGAHLVLFAFSMSEVTPNDAYVSSLPGIYDAIVLIKNQNNYLK